MIVFGFILIVIGCAIFIISPHHGLISIALCVLGIFIVPLGMVMHDSWEKKEEQEKRKRMIEEIIQSQRQMQKNVVPSEPHKHSTAKVLFGKCTDCGKSGFFLVLDENKRCVECAEKVEKAEKEEQAKFEAYYTDLLSCFKKQQEYVDVGDDPVQAVDLIPKLEAKIKECDELRIKFHNPHHEKRLAEKLIQSITYNSDSDRLHGRGRLDEVGIYVYAYHYPREFTKEIIFSEIDKTIDRYQETWNDMIKKIWDNAKFQNRINSIPSVDVVVSDTKHSKLHISELNELIKYTNITKKTNLDRIGSFVVIDTETTGLVPSRDHLVEIAAIRFENWRPVEKFHTLLSPGKRIPSEASAINGITDAMVTSAPTFSQIIDSLDSFIGESNLVGHNLPFDLKFLYKHGYNFAAKKRHYYDTCEIASKTLRKQKLKRKWDKEFEEYVIVDDNKCDVLDYKLTTLCEYYKIRDRAFAHRALSDAYATGMLFYRLAWDKTHY